MHRRQARLFPLLLIAAAVCVVFVGCRSLPEATGSDLDPVAIETAIRGQIAAQYPDETLDIGIAVTEDGVVTLSGSVEDDVKRDKLAEIAGDVHDVRRVINRLTIR